MQVAAAEPGHQLGGPHPGRHGAIVEQRLEYPRQRVGAPGPSARRRRSPLPLPPEVPTHRRAHSAPAPQSGSECWRSAALATSQAWRANASAAFASPAKCAMACSCSSRCVRSAQRRPGGAASRGAGRWTTRRLPSPAKASTQRAVVKSHGQTWRWFGNTSSNSSIDRSAAAFAARGVANRPSGARPPALEQRLHSRGSSPVCSATRSRAACIAPSASSRQRAGHGERTQPSVALEPQPVVGERLDRSFDLGPPGRGVAEKPRAARRAAPAVCDRRRPGAPGLRARARPPPLSRAASISPRMARISPRLMASTHATRPSSGYFWARSESRSERSNRRVMNASPANPVSEAAVGAAGEQARRAQRPANERPHFVVSPLEEEQRDPCAERALLVLAARRAPRRSRRPP